MNNATKKSIEDIFEEIRKVIPKNLSRAEEWLYTLEEDTTYKFTREWVAILKSFIRGLWAAEAINIEIVDDIDKILAENHLL